MPKQQDKQVDILSVSSPGFPVLLLTYMLRSKDFMMKAGYLVTEEDFFHESEAAYQLVAHLAHAFWEQNHEVIPQQLLWSSISDRLRNSDGFLDEDGLIMLKETLEAVYRAPVTDIDAGSGWMLTQLELFLKDRRLRMAMQAVATAPADEMAEKLEEAQQVQRSSTISSGERIECFQPDKAVLTPLIRRPTHVSFLDGLLGGGVAPNDLIGLTGPTGGGKTLLSLQLGCEMANHEEDVAIFTYEFPFMPAYQIRCYSYLSGLKSSLIKGQSFDSMNPDNRRKIMQALEKVSAYIHPFDMTAEGSAGGIDGLRANLRLLCSEKKTGCANKTNHPRLVIIDQFIPYISRYLAHKNLKIDYQRAYMQRAVDELRMLAFEMQTAILLLHQVSPDLNTRPSYIRPTKNDAAECKSFAFWMNWCLALGTLDERKKCCWLKLAKANEAETAERVLLMDGDAGRFSDVTGRITVQGRKFVDAAEMENGIANADTT